MCEFKRALEWTNAFLENEEYSRDTYEDTCGTGNMDEEERRVLYEAMESSINLFKTLKYAVEQQINNGWIPVSEKLPTSDGRFEVTVKGKGKRHVEILNFYRNANEGKGKWGDRWDTTNVLAWKERNKPYSK